MAIGWPSWSYDIKFECTWDRQGTWKAKMGNFELKPKILQTKEEGDLAINTVCYSGRISYLLMSLMLPYMQRQIK